MVKAQNPASIKLKIRHLSRNHLVPRKIFWLIPSPAIGPCLGKVQFKICKASSPASVNFKYFSRRLSRVFPPQNCLITRNDHLTVAGTNINKNPCPGQGGRLPVPGAGLYFAK